MNRPNLRDFRNRVAAYAQSVGSPLGVCLGNIPALAGLVNISTERLLFDPTCPDEGWWGGWGKYVFNINRLNPYITLPRGLARVILLDVCKSPMKVQNGFYEFLDFGEGLFPKDCKPNAGPWQAYDRGSVPTLGKLACTPQLLCIMPTDARDVSKTFIAQGTDQNGNTILSTDPATNNPIQGEQISMAQPFKLSVNQFSSISGLEKDSTYGPVIIMQQDPVTGFQQPLSMMEPSETSASYRTYLVNGVPCHGCKGDGNVQVQAMCKFEFQPVASDSDYLVIPNVPALMAECESVRMESMDNQKAQAIAVQKHAKALGLLFGELDHYLGKERPAISVPIFGSDPLRPSFQ